LLHEFTPKEPECVQKSYLFAMDTLPELESLRNITHVNRLRAGRHTVFGEARYAAGGTCGPRVQRDFQLVVFQSGGMRQVLGGEEFSAGAGEVALLLPGRQEHLVFAEDGPTRHTWSAVAPVAVSKELALRLARAPAVLPMSAAFARLMEAAFAKPAGDSAEAQAFFDALGLALLLEFACMAASGGAAPAHKGVVEKAVEHMVGRLEKPLRLPELAAAAGVSRQHLIKCFKAQLGTTPSRHLWSLRTAHAAELLLHTDLPVAEVAVRCGFKTSFHFSRVFKAQHHASPREYRAKMWKGRK